MSEFGSRKRNPLKDGTTAVDLHPGKDARQPSTSGIPELPKRPLSNHLIQQFSRHCPQRLPDPKLCPYGGTCHTCPARVQAKLKINPPGDKYEQEADRVADKVMRMPEPKLQRDCPSCDEEETVQPKLHNPPQVSTIQRQEEEPEEEEEESIQAKMNEMGMLQRQEEEPDEEEEEPVQAKVNETGMVQRQEEELEEDEEESVQAKLDEVGLVQRQEEEPEEEEEEPVQAKVNEAGMVQHQEEEPDEEDEEPIQTKLEFGQQNDEYEREADRVAEEVFHERGNVSPVQQRSFPTHDVIRAQRANPNRRVPFWDQLPAYVQTDLSRPGYDQKWFDARTARTRLTVLNLYVKLKGMKLWRYVLQESSTHNGCLEFTADVNGLKRSLRSRWNFRDPEASSRKWDSAEKRATGALHFKHFTGWPTAKVQAHIDQKGLWLGSKWFWWIGIPVTGLRHLAAYDSYQDVYGIRDILLTQGWDPKPLLGKSTRPIQRKVLPASLAGTSSHSHLINEPGDTYEREADGVAEQVVQMPEPRLQRVCAECEEEETLQSKPQVGQITPQIQRQIESEEEEEREPVQTKVPDSTSFQRQTEEPEEDEEEEPIQTKHADGANLEVATSLEARISSLRGGGQPLQSSVRGFFESRFGYDFNRVRVHTDGNANRLAQAVNARAFTRGQSIVFGRGQYAPETSTGRRLLAHELTHVVQQNAGKSLRPCSKERITLLSRERSIQCAYYKREELHQYLRYLRKSRKIENKSDSDDKALAVVHWWSAGVHGFGLKKVIKSLLILELLKGGTYSSEEQAILELLERSSNSELNYIFSKGGVTPQALKADFHGKEFVWLKEFFERRFVGGWKAALKGNLKPKGKPLSRSMTLFAAFPERAKSKARGLAVAKLRRYIKKIDVAFSSIRDIARLLWWVNPGGFRKSFPGLRNKKDFRFDVGNATATFNDGATVVFPVSGGAIKLRRYRTHRTGRRYLSIHRKGGASYVNRKGDPMPHASFFYRGQAFHGCGNRNYFLNLRAEHYCLDYPSHGCIHVENSTMAKLSPFILVRRTKVRVV
ncbi:MAG: DUF4157 domain-containing protein [Anaerolineales bacterium]|nr:DUF4157 domain-containing protein [Anaerolineales bacterium]